MVLHRVVGIGLAFSLLLGGGCFAKTPNNPSNPRDADDADQGMNSDANDTGDNPDGFDASRCGSDEMLVEYKGQEKCYETCTPQSDCGPDKRCVNSTICVETTDASKAD